MRTRKYNTLSALSAVLMVALAARVVMGNNTNDTTDGNKQRPIDKGMEPLYTMTNTFLKLVQPKENQELLDQLGFDQEKLKNGEYPFAVPVTDVGQRVAKFYIGYDICVAVGLLFVIIMPIVGLVFCCCRCCGKCGGNPDPREGKNAKCARVTCGIILLTLNTVMVAGTICAFLSNELVRQQLVEDQGPVNSLEKSFVSLDSYKSRTIQELNDTVVGGLKSTIDDIITTLNAFPTNAQKKMSSVTQAGDILTKAKNLAEVAGKINSSLTTADRSLKTMQTLGTTLNNDLNKIKQDISNQLSSCLATTRCKKINDNMNAVTTGANFSQIGSISDQLKKVQDVVGTDLSGLIEKGQQEYNNVTERVKGEIQGKVKEVEKEANNLLAQVTSSVGKLTAQLDRVNTSQYRQILQKDVKPVLRVNGQYVSYAGIGLCCILLLIVLFYYLGLAFGACGEPPYDDANVCNRGVGANLLLAGVGFTFLFSWLLMLITTILFLLGGFMHTDICPHVLKPQDSKLLSLADSLLSGSLSFNLSISSILKDCKDNKGAFKAFKLDQAVNLDQILDLSRYDIESEINKLKNISITVQDIEILNADTKKQLENLAKSNLEGINFQKFYEELSKSLTSQDLTTVANNLRRDAAQLPSAQKTVIENKASELDSLNTNVVTKMKAEQPKLKASVDSLKAAIDGSGGTGSGFKNATYALIQSFDNAATQIKTKGAQIVIDFAVAEAQKIYKKIADSVSDVKGQIQNNIGKCEPLYKVVDSSFKSICVTFLYPVNGFWFSLGWCLFFFIPCLIVATKLATQYRKSEEYDGDDKSFDDPNFDAYQGVYPGDNIPLEDVRSKKNRRSGRGQQNRGYERDEYTSSRAAPYRHPPSRDSYYRDNYQADNYHRNGMPYDARGGYRGGGGDYPRSHGVGYGDGYPPPPASTPPNPPHYYK